MKSFESLIDLSGTMKPSEFSFEGGNSGWTDFAPPPGLDFEDGKPIMPSRLDEMSADLEETLEEHADLEDIIERACLFYQKGRYAEVIDLILEVPITYVSRSEQHPLMLLVRAYGNIGNLEAAMDWSERLIGHEPVNARWYYLRATIQQERGEDGAALISLRQAIFLEPEYVLAYFVLGNIYRQSGDQGQARRCFERVVELLEEVDSLTEIPDSDGLMAGQLMNIARTLVEGG
jgi:chemotaxis protein methyltransferase CheR